MQQFDFTLSPPLSTLVVMAGVASALIIAFDLRTCRQPMRIMQPVWILTGLWANLFGLVAYFWFGRARHCPLLPRDTTAKPKPKMTGMKMEGATPRPLWQSVVLSTLHCGAGCTLADLVGEWLMWVFPVALGGSVVAGGWVIDYALALLLGIGFQYAAIRNMEPHTTPREVFKRAARADVWSLTAWQAGMYGWMAVVIFLWGDGQIPPRNEFYFWSMMQVAMGCGFLTALPINAWLIHRGVKHPM